MLSNVNEEDTDIFVNPLFLHENATGPSRDRIEKFQDMYFNWFGFLRIFYTEL